MAMRLDLEERSLIRLHADMVILAAVVLALPVALTLGGRLTVLVVAHHLVAFVVSRGPSRVRLRRLWWFAVTLSVWQVAPDAVLALGLGTIVFPDLGVPRIAGVSVFMAGLWALPTITIVGVARAIGRRRGMQAEAAAAALTALVVFVAAEWVLPTFGVWEPVGVTMLGPVALYVLVPEMLLGIAMLVGVR